MTFPDVQIGVVSLARDERGRAWVVGLGIVRDDLSGFAEDAIHIELAVGDLKGAPCDPDLEVPELPQRGHRRPGWSDHVARGCLSALRLDIGLFVPFCVKQNAALLHTHAAIVFIPSEGQT